MSTKRRKIIHYDQKYSEIYIPCKQVDDEGSYRFGWLTTETSQSGFHLAS